MFCFCVGPWQIETMDDFVTCPLAVVQPHQTWGANMGNGSLRQANWTEGLHRISLGLTTLLSMVFWVSGGGQAGRALLLRSLVVRSYKGTLVATHCKSLVCSCMAGSKLQVGTDVQRASQPEEKDAVCAAWHRCPS